MGCGGEAGFGGLPPLENEFQRFGKAAVRSGGMRAVFEPGSKKV